MIPSAIISLARRQSGCTTGIVTEAEAFDFINFVIDDFWGDIILTNPWYWLTTRTYDTVAWTGEYTFATPIATAALATSTFWLAKTTKIWVKEVASATYYKEYPLTFIEGMGGLPDIEAANGTEKATITDTSITLYPTPENSITNWLRIIGQKSHFDLSASTEDVEGCLMIPSNRHYVLIEWLKFWMYGNMGVNFDQSRLQAKASYEVFKQECLDKIVNRTQNSPEYFIPDLSYLS